MKDYFPQMTIIGEKSFGKGSVQSLKNYYDGSTLKYTTAKWFTGKTKTGIDGVGITPDILLPIDIENLKNNEIDNQLERAKSN
jgi:carboxyl-terminal processing protease